MADFWRWMDDTRRRVEAERAASRFVFLDRARWTVEHLSGKVVTSLRDGSFGTIWTITNHGDVFLEWGDAASACRNKSGLRYQERRLPRRKVKKVIMGIMLPSERREMVVSGPEAVKQVYSFLEPSVAQFDDDRIQERLTTWEGIDIG